MKKNVSYIKKKLKNESDYRKKISRSIGQSGELGSIESRFIMSLLTDGYAIKIRNKVFRYSDSIGFYDELMKA